MQNHQELYSPRTHPLGVKVYFNDKRVVWCFNGFIIECKITPGMELFEQQYFTEQYIILTSIEERHDNWTKLTLISLYRTHVHHKYSMT